MSSSPGKVHGFWSVTGRFDDAARAHSRAAAALKQAFKPAGARDGRRQ
jgi:hypothetical protein